MTTLSSQPEEMNVELLMTPSVCYSKQVTTSPPLLVPRSYEGVFFPSVECQPQFFLPAISSEDSCDDNEECNFSLLPRLSSSMEFPTIAMATDESDCSDRDSSDVHSHHNPSSTSPDIFVDATFSFSDDGDGSMDGLPYFPDLEEISSNSDFSSDDSFMEYQASPSTVRPRLPSSIELNCLGFFGP